MWSSSKPCYGDHIRVCRGYYYHHGIYVSDDYVIHFASKENVDRIDPKDAKIIITSLSEFLKDGILEVRVFNSEELSKKRSPSDIVNYAFMQVDKRLGTYNLISNNCEHFANECVFGQAVSEQVEDVFSKIFGGIKR